jgi:hypothetical protein
VAWVSKPVHTNSDQHKHDTGGRTKYEGAYTSSLPRGVWKRANRVAKDTLEGCPRTKVVQPYTRTRATRSFMDVAVHHVVRPANSLRQKSPASSFTHLPRRPSTSLASRNEHVILVFLSLPSSLHPLLACLLNRDHTPTSRYSDAKSRPKTLDTLQVSSRSLATLQGAVAWVHCTPNSPLHFHRYSGPRLSRHACAWPVVSELLDCLPHVEFSDLLRHDHFCVGICAAEGGRIRGWIAMNSIRTMSKMATQSTNMLGMSGTTMLKCKGAGEILFHMA